MPTKEGTQTLVIERVFDAPRELVWKVWTEPEHAMKWWGPRGFTAPVAKMDFRVGGKFLIAMQSPDFNDGKPIWSTGVYKERSCRYRRSFPVTASPTNTATLCRRASTGWKAHWTR